MLAPDASALRQAVEDPELVSHWRAAGVVALLLPAGHPPLPGLAPGASQPDAGDLFWIAGTVEHDRPMLVVTTRLGEVLFHTDPLGRADQGTEATPCRT
ncbi:MAG: hypothetical protein ACRDQ5_11220 [Sciscionella sp.]